MEKITVAEMDALKAALDGSRELMAAMGDEARLRLLRVMLDGPCNGNRVADLTEKAAMSRASVSHHLQVLKRAGLLKSRKEGTLVYYYFAPDAQKIRALQQLFTTISDLIPRAPDREGDELHGNRVN